MKAVRQLGALLVLLMWAAVPTMVCVMPTAQMTESERACCRQMKMSCGNMDMPSSHGCCHKDIQADQASAVHTNVPAGPSLDLTAISIVPVIVPSAQPGTFFIGSSDASPPKPPPAAINVLRI